MNNRERLIELIKQGQNATNCAYIVDCPVSPEECENCELNTVVDYLLFNGVTVQKHGRWEDYPKEKNVVFCSKCKDVYIFKSWLIDGKWDYCPNCGAKMMEDSNDKI